MVEAVTLKTGKAVDFGQTGRPLTWYQALAAQGIDAVVLDMMSPGWTQDYHYAVQAGLGVMLFQGYWPQGFTMPAQADHRALLMVSAVQAVGLAPKTNVWLDWESVPASVSVGAAEQWVNTWAQTIKAHVPVTTGLYEGKPQPLGGGPLYTALTAIDAYWRSASAVPTVQTRGYVMLQTAGNVTRAGEVVDDDTIQTDQLGGTVTATRDPTAGSSPASSAAEAALRQQVQALTQRVGALEGLATDLQHALNTYHP